MTNNQIINTWIDMGAATCGRHRQMPAALPFLEMPCRAAKMPAANARQNLTINYKEMTIFIG